MSESGPSLAQAVVKAATPVSTAAEQHKEAADRIGPIRCRLENGGATLEGVVADEPRAAQTAASKRTWQTAAAGWERNADLVARTSEPVTRWVVEHIEPRPGDIVLELGAGPGDLGFAISARVAPAGRVISTDFAPAMVSVARRRAVAFGVDNIEFRVMDAQDIDIADASVDAVVHRFGPMLLPDPERSARHVERVLRRGGRYATVVWGAPSANPMFPMFGAALAGLGLAPAGPPPSGSAPDLTDPDVTRELLGRCGFVDVVVDTVDHPFAFASFDELWAMPTEIAGPVAELLRRLDETDYRRAQEAIRDGAERFRDGDGYAIPGLAVCAFARTPDR